MICALSSLRRFSSFETLKITTIDGVQMIALDREKARNVSSLQPFKDVASACQAAGKDDAVRAVIIAGEENYFTSAVGNEDLMSHTTTKMRDSIPPELWSGLLSVRKPMIAAVSGVAFGFGFMLAMSCDIIIASSAARFALPSMVVANLPVPGGTQRLTYALGKSKAMELILTGRHLTAKEALQKGLVSRIVPRDKVFEEATTIAKRIVGFSQPVVTIAKESVHRAFETTLAAGLKFEQAAFRSTFCLEDRKEGMEAFVAKRQPNFLHK